MGNIKNFFFDEFFDDFDENGKKITDKALWLHIDEPLWFQASGTKASNGKKKRDLGDSSKTDNKSGNDCDCCDDRPPAEPSTNSKSKKDLTDLYDEFWWNVQDIADEAIQVLMKKHEDYGPSNIADAPGGPINGLAVRLHDKVARLNNLLSTGRTPNNESIYDTFLDVANYGLIGMLVLKEKWDKG